MGELVGVALRRASAAQRPQLAAGAVVLCGGGARTAGLASRLLTELQAAQPAGRAMRVVKALDPSLDAWRGAAGAAGAGLAAQYCMTRQEYEEQGAERLRHRGVLERYF